MEVCYKCKLIIKENEQYINVPWGLKNKVKMHVECYNKNKKESKRSSWSIFGIIVLILVVSTIVFFLVLLYFFIN
ncbi:hypothetical protein LT335_00341 [Spiroplasma sp. JKS002669]|uniref:hypothetical protein n=1 Tax=Spiroplasma attinicola TaxID=2904537 RepID=UPI002022FE7C|nr:MULTISPECIES: hypothetical protein [unclassified Spiroplasma]MCL6428793.1 hypothetical protein [Spiroplasma sp. JKS002669]MCL8210722.1 hypothetical protein [Spiroplasma sp. JKS002671]